MSTFIALFRGINVGGNCILPMKELKVILEKLGLQSVRTYIQSGNVVFKSEEKDRRKLSVEISAAVKKKYGFEPRVMLLSAEELENAIKANPFPEAQAEPVTLHLGFLADVPQNPDRQELERLKAGKEQYKLDGKVFYLYAPEGIGRSKLAARVERLLGVEITDRNWRTVQKIMEMVNEAQ